MTEELILPIRKNLSKEGNALRQHYWNKVYQLLLAGDIKKAVEGIVAITSNNVHKAKKFLKSA